VGRVSTAEGRVFGGPRPEGEAVEAARTRLEEATHTDL
jgi:hypothetical protein